jgi:glycosyltransferase involved in cell wall biosynthesis
VNQLITICIPTCDRPQFLREAVLSAFAQTYRPLEIVIGDDSRFSSAEPALTHFHSNATIELHYKKNSKPIGQAGNANELFTRACGDRIVLLHDDDLLLPDAVRILAGCWNSYPQLTVAFGKQYVISATGEIRQNDSEKLNQIFFRTPERAGLQDCAVESALLQQFPNDGFMIRSDVARRILFREYTEVGDAVDFDFGIRVALHGATFCFVDEYLSKYRITPGSITSSSATAEYMFPIIQGLRVPHEAKAARDLALQRLAPFYVKKLALNRRRAEALKLLFGSHFDRRLLWSKKGFILCGQILFPGVDRILQKVRKLGGSRRRSSGFGSLS